MNKTLPPALAGQVERSVRPPFRPTQAHMAVAWMLQGRRLPHHGGWIFNPYSSWWVERPNVRANLDPTA